MSYPCLAENHENQPIPCTCCCAKAITRDSIWRTKAGETSDLRGCDFRGIDLRGVDVANIDFSDCYFRQADLRGLDLRSCRLEGASLHAAHVSGAYFPLQFAPEEIEMSVRLGTRMRPR